MSRMYRVAYSGTLTNAGGNTDLLSIQPADDKPCRLVGWLIGQTSELGDVAEEGLRISVQRMPATFTVGSGGAAVTPAGVDSTQAAAGATTRCNDTTVSTTSGTATVLEELSWNIRSSPWERWIPEELRPLVRQGEALVIRLEAAPADDLSANLTFFFEEL